MELIRYGTPTISIAEQTRNVAGLVTARSTDISGPGLTALSAWSYDKLGRVEDQAVGTYHNQVARRERRNRGIVNAETAAS